MNPRGGDFNLRQRSGVKRRKILRREKGLFPVNHNESQKKPPGTPGGFLHKGAGLIPVQLIEEIHTNVIIPVYAGVAFQLDIMGNDGSPDRTAAG